MLQYHVVSRGVFPELSYRVVEPFNLQEEIFESTYDSEENHRLRILFNMLPRMFKPIMF